MATKAQKAVEAAQLKAALEAAAPECSADTEKRCQGMTFALFYQGERGGGIEVGFTMNVKTGDDVGMAFIYRTPKGNKILFLRLCPWCGASLEHPAAKKTSDGKDSGRNK